MQLSSSAHGSALSTAHATSIGISSKPQSRRHLHQLFAAQSMISVRFNFPNQKRSANANPGCVLLPFPSSTECSGWTLSHQHRPHWGSNRARRTATGINFQLGWTLHPNCSTMRFLKLPAAHACAVDNSTNKKLLLATKRATSKNQAATTSTPRGRSATRRRLLRLREDVL